MNIALGAVLIFILLLPPIAFYVSYSFGRFAKAGPKFTLLDGLLASAVFSLFIHTVAIAIIGKEIRFDILLKLAGGELKDLETKVSNATLGHALRQFALYNAVIFFIAVISGRATRYCIQRWGPHERYELLRQKNRWWYLFNGYELTKLGLTRHDFDVLRVDVAMDTSDGTTIYTGYLIEFVCDGEALDRIYLSSVVRRDFRKKAQAEGEEVQRSQPGDPVVIPGNLLCIAYKDIKNLNLRFILLEDSLDDVEELPETAAV